MKFILKSTYRGLVSGLAVCVALYLVLFLIEGASFLKEMVFPSDPDNPISVDGKIVFDNYTAFLPVWSWTTALFVAICAGALGMIIGFGIGIAHTTSISDKFRANKMALIDDGTNRQKITNAKNIKTMSETLTKSCENNLKNMKNFVSTNYTSEDANNDIMTELVKFVEYEQFLKDSVESNNKEGGR